MGPYRFALRPRWIATHVLVVAVVVTMVGLGFWQLDRLDQRRDRNELVEARSALPAEPVGELVDPGAGTDVTDELRYRAVSATGEYVDGATTAVRTSQGGIPGAWVLTPMRLGSGEVVVVLRGFARTPPDGSLPEPPPPAGEVRVEGLAVPVERAEPITRSAARELAEGQERALPVLVQAESSDPADAETLEPVPRPELGEGPHLSYAVQWFLFSTVAAVGYPFLLRREARRRRSEPAVGDPRRDGPAVVRSGRDGSA